ncbi:hypothetical protein GCM10022204_30880 [Microlunatus aurantiacus]|uniref:CopC domain-containing protein n=1 Tax=Microlunatus aurantiacus TaxID=446786 RepID=A0ABP7DUV2_9ACTN
MNRRDPGHGHLWAVAMVVAVLFTLVGTPQTASAHNALVSTTPGDGKTVAEPPSSVVLTFNEPAIATGTKVLVTGPDGASATDGDPKLVDNTVEQDLESQLPAGEYEVEWRVTSADGHPINGRFTFTVRTGTETSASPSATPTTSSSASPSPSVASSSPVPTATDLPTNVATPVASPADQTGASRSGWWWLLAVVPVGLAAVLGYRFNRRR